jgi:large subunit ribosomal protein L19
VKATGFTKETILSHGVTSRGFPTFSVGDRIEVSVLIKEKTRERIQKFEGDVIAYRNSGIATTFKVRKIGDGGVGVEMTLPYHSPIIANINLLRRGKVRRAKLFYLRDRIGQKAIRIKPKHKFAPKAKS